MSMIADKIEKFILDRMREEQEKLILKRNELADELNCAPSQISYVLSTRFSNERGFDVESRRGLGGYIRIKKLNPESSDSLPTVTTYRIYEGQNTVERLIDMRDVDQSLFQLLQSEKITRREAQLMHNSFATLIENVDIEERNEAVRQLYATMVDTLRKE
ncbi:MAG: CtsR family transcriptional regulator [Veillonella sp.]|uniref:CtsR family transcriptional regulator n=1 Tax=Veillonella sp. TaxID=1926307 RepID=UPI0029124E28|nr:CtsR family transcriptional regulator [Veillonella sp.]MDU5003525.1 CtsR family transcriptional regulator [Veillonella sp.]